MNNKQRQRTPEEKSGESIVEEPIGHRAGGAEFEACLFFGPHVHNVRLTPELLFFLFLFSALSLQAIKIKGEKSVKKEDEKKGTLLV